MQQTINPDLLIPPDSDLAQLLLQWSEDTDSRTWNIANLTNELIEELEGGVATKADIYKAVATRCKGQKPNTIRRWAECAADYPMDIQQKYSSLLSFQHFKVSRRLFKDGLTPSIEYALDWCIKGNDMKLSAGKFHTVGQMIDQFVPRDDKTSPLRKMWNKVKDNVYDQFLIVDNDYYRDRLLGCFHEIDYIVSALDKADKETSNVIQTR